MPAPCPFCSLPRDRVLHERETAFAIRDGFPVSPGHTLIIPRRHAGYNIGINDGADPRGGVRWVLPDKAAYWNLA